MTQMPTISEDRIGAALLASHFDQVSGGAELSEASGELL